MNSPNKHEPVRSQNRTTAGSSETSALHRLATVAETLRKSPGAEGAQPAIDGIRASLGCTLAALYRLDSEVFVLEAASHDDNQAPPTTRLSREEGLLAAADGEPVRLVLEGAAGEPVGLLVQNTTSSLAADKALLLDIFVELLSTHLCRQATDTMLLRTSARLARLNDLSHRLSAHNELPDLLEEATAGLRELIGIGQIAVYLIQEGAPVLTASKGSNFDFPEAIQLATADGTPVLGQAGAPRVVVGDSLFEGRNLVVELLRSSQGINGALLLIIDDDVLAADPEVRSGLSALANHLGIAVHNTLLLAEIRRQAIYDDLTGLAGRRHFMAELTREITRARRGGGPLSLMMLDADRFKDLNDTHGHPAGDAVLIAMARALVDGTRSIDIVGRLGGEEMGVVLPGATAEVASLIAERLRASIQALDIPWDNNTLKVTVSIGVAGWTEFLKADDLIAEADQALYQAKHLGRDLVVTQPAIDTVAQD